MVRAPDEHLKHTFVEFVGRLRYMRGSELTYGPCLTALNANDVKRPDD